MSFDLLMNTKLKNRRLHETLYMANEPRNAIGRDVGKPTPNFATPVVTPPKETKNQPYSEHVGLGIPLDTKLGKRSQSLLPDFEM